MESKTFNHLLCLHNVAFSGYHGKTMRSIVFTDGYGKTYIWITTAGLEYTEGHHYDIKAKCNERHILSYVKFIKHHDILHPDPDGEKSEQPDHVPVDVFDLIFSTSDTHLTND